MRSRHRPIFPGSHPPSIFGTDELNYCVRDGNRWDLIAISTGLGKGQPVEDASVDHYITTSPEACQGGFEDPFHPQGRGGISSIIPPFTLGVFSSILSLVMIG